MLDYIGGVLGLGSERVARVLAELCDKDARVVVVGDDLGRALFHKGRRVVVVSRARKRRKGAPPQVAAEPAALPFADASVDAVYLSGLPGAGISALREAARVVRDDGRVALAASTSALLRKVAPPEVMAAMAVHAGWMDIEQRRVGTTILTLGRARHW